LTLPFDIFSDWFAAFFSKFVKLIHDPEVTVCSYGSQIYSCNE
jgi:hypothetical protein